MWCWGFTGWKAWVCTMSWPLCWLAGGLLIPSGGVIGVLIMAAGPPIICCFLSILNCIDESDSDDVSEVDIESNQNRVTLGDTRRNGDHVNQNLSTSLTYNTLRRNCDHVNLSYRHDLSAPDTETNRRRDGDRATSSYISDGDTMNSKNCSDGLPRYKDL